MSTLDDLLDRAETLLLIYGPDWPAMLRDGRLSRAEAETSVADPERLAAHRAAVAAAVEHLLAVAEVRP